MLVYEGNFNGNSIPIELEALTGYSNDFGYEDKSNEPQEESSTVEYYCNDEICGIKAYVSI